MKFEKRTDYEEELAAALMLAWRPARIDALAGREPDWQKLEADIALKAEPVLKKTQRQAALALFLATLGVRRSPMGFDPYAGQAARLAGDLVRSRRSRWNGDDPSKWVLDNLTRDVAKRSGVTEVTDAISTGEDAARDSMEERLGVKLIAVWNIDPTSNVCPICLPLDGKPEHIWLREFPHGPPAHPNCNCFKTYEIDR